MVVVGIVALVVVAAGGVMQQRRVTAEDEECGDGPGYADRLVVVLSSVRAKGGDSWDSCETLVGHRKQFAGGARVWWRHWGGAMDGDGAVGRCCSL